MQNKDLLYLCEKDQLDAYIYLINLFQLFYHLHGSNKQVHNQEVTSVHAAYSIIHACVRVMSRR